MGTKPLYTLQDLVPAVHRRCGGLQRLEVKEIPLTSVDGKKLVYASKYKDWNVGPKAAPVVVYVNRRIFPSGWTADGATLFENTPDALSINRFGQVTFANALLDTDVVHASFTWRVFSDWDVFAACQPHAITMVESRLPLEVDPDQIPDYLFELLILAAMVHLRKSLDAEQGLYYSYSIQEQSHQLQQVHKNLLEQIQQDEASFDAAADSVLWYRLQGKARKTTSIKLPYHSSPDPNIGPAAYGSLTWGMRG